MYAEALRGILAKIVERSTSGQERVAVAYSGGLDSSVLEALARSFTATVCYTSSVEGAYDQMHAPRHAAEDGCTTKLLIVTQKELMRYVGEAGEVLDSSGPMEIAFTVPLLKVFDACAEEVVLAGNGADESFGGYARYLEAENPAGMMAQDLQKAQRESHLVQQAASSRGKRLVTPYLSREVMDCAAEIPFKEKIRNGERKAVLRDVARLMGLECRDRPKKACQYSSGVMKEMEKLARDSGLSVSQWTASVVSGKRRIP